MCNWCIVGSAPSDKEVVPVRLTQRQLELLDQLDEVFGNSRAEKAKTILVNWLLEHWGEYSKQSNRRQSDE